jgi:hypothetical protein
MNKPTTTDITRKKTEYGDDINQIIDLLAFNPENVFIAGSYGIRSMLYPVDVDMIEPIDYTDSFVKQFKTKIRTINDIDDVYLMDVKIGQVDDWEIVDDTAYIENGRIYGYDYDKSKSKVADLLKEGIITTEEANEYNRLLKPKPTIEEMGIIKKEVRPHILRWTYREIMKGEKTYRGQTFKLQNAFTMGMSKVDIITFLNNGRITEASIIYDIRKKGLRRNKWVINPIRSFKQDIQYYKSVGDYFKVLKRMYSLSVYRKKDERIHKLYEVLNGDLGILNQVINDIDILTSLVENHKTLPKAKISKTISEFINRLNNVYSINDYIRQQKRIIPNIRKAINSRSSEQIIKHLEPVRLKLRSILNKHSKKVFNKIK